MQIFFCQLVNWAANARLGAPKQFDMSYLSPAMAVSLMPSPKDVYFEDGNRFSNTMKIILYLICQTDQLAKFVLILFFRSHKRSPHFQKQSLFPFLFLFGWGVVTYVFHGILRLRTVYHNSAYAILERTVFVVFFRNPTPLLPCTLTPKYWKAQKRFYLFSCICHQHSF